eukprot:1161255-Pelagomonas_calceolata.AAC.1
MGADTGPPLPTATRSCSWVRLRLWKCPGRHILLYDVESYTPLAPDGKLQAHKAAIQRPQVRCKPVEVTMCCKACDKQARLGPSQPPGSSPKGEPDAEEALFQPLNPTRAPLGAPVSRM